MSDATSNRLLLAPEDVWRALEEIPDPEIPVISIVDLGVVKDVRVEGERVQVDFTPTFMGCPALETMRAQMEEAIRGLGAEPEGNVVLDDSWSTDRISAEGREKLRAAGFAPPAPRSAGTPTLVQLERGPFRCPWWGGHETPPRHRVGPPPGPAPCRSLRYCKTCRQPFEQFKTI